MTPAIKTKLRTETMLIWSTGGHFDLNQVVGTQFKPHKCTFRAEITCNLGLSSDVKTSLPSFNQHISRYQQQNRHLCTSVVWPHSGTARSCSNSILLNNMLSSDTILVVILYMTVVPPCLHTSSYTKYFQTIKYFQTVGQEMLAIIRCRVFCLPDCYPKT